MESRGWTTATLAAHPVFSQLNLFLNTLHPSPWTTNFRRCLETNKSGVKQCGNKISKEYSCLSKNIFDELLDEDQFPEADDFATVYDFLSLIHCWRHGKDVVARFDLWREQADSRQKLDDPLPELYIQVVDSDGPPNKQLDSGAMAALSLEDEQPLIKLSLVTSVANEKQPVIEPVLVALPRDNHLTDSSETKASPCDVHQQTTPSSEPCGDHQGQALPLVEDEDTSSSFDQSTASSSSEASDISLVEISFTSTLATTPPATPDRYVDSQPVTEPPTESDRAETSKTGESGTYEPQINIRSPELRRRLTRYKDHPLKTALINAIHTRWNEQDFVPGVLYVVADPHNDRSFKVGYSKDSAPMELAKPGNCDRDCSVVWPIGDHDPFVGAKRVERLVLADMEQSRRLVKGCPYCHEKDVHRGWIDASREEVLDSVRLWTSFVRDLAYKDGELTEEAEKVFHLVCRPRMLPHLLSEMRRDVVSSKSQDHSKEDRRSRIHWLTEMTEAVHDIYSIFTERIKAPGSRVRQKLQRSYGRVVSKLVGSKSAVPTTNIAQVDEKQEAKVPKIFIGLVQRFYAPEVEEENATARQKMPSRDVEASLRNSIYQIQEDFVQVWDHARSHTDYLDVQEVS